MCVFRGVGINSLKPSLIKGASHPQTTFAVWRIFECNCMSQLCNCKWLKFYKMGWEQTSSYSCQRKRDPCFAANITKIGVCISSIFCFQATPSSFQFIMHIFALFKPIPRGHCTVIKFISIPTNFANFNMGVHLSSAETLKAIPASKNKGKKNGSEIRKRTITPRRATKPTKNVADIVELLENEGISVYKPREEECQRSITNLNLHYRY